MPFFENADQLLRILTCSDSHPNGPGRLRFQVSHRGLISSAGMRRPNGQARDQRDFAPTNRRTSADRCRCTLAGSAG